MSMTLEKKIAIASVALCLLTPLALLLYFEFTNSYEIKISLRIQLFFRNLVVWFWSPMIASFILYTRLDRKSTRLNSSHSRASRMPSSA